MIRTQTQFKTVDGATLTSQALRPTNFIVDTLISQGLHVLAGASKAGKSWLALWLSVMIAQGNEVWGMKVKQGTTLYLALEDSTLRIQNRLFDITDDAPENVHFCTDSLRLGGGLETQIESFMAEHPDTVLIIIDTLQMIRGTNYPFIGQIPLCKLRPIALENMMNELRQRTYRGKKIQEETVQKYLTVVSAVLSDAKRNEVIQKNPARMIDLPMTQQRKQIIPSPQEAQEILSLLNDEPFVYRVFFFLAIYTGCRRGELAALRWSDFTMDGNGAILTVRHSRSIVAGQGVTEGSTKNGRTRQIYIEPDVLDILKGLYFERSQYSDEYLFVNDDGKPIHPDTFTKRLRKLYDQNGFFKAYHLHTLRHYFVTSLLHSGVDKQTVAELAGHGDTSFLERT